MKIALLIIAIILVIAFYGLHILYLLICENQYEIAKLRKRIAVLEDCEIANTSDGK